MYFVYLFHGQIHSVFGVFGGGWVCISHLGAHCIQNPSAEAVGTGATRLGACVNPGSETSVHDPPVVKLPRSPPTHTPLYPYVRYDLYGRRPLAAHEPELPQLPSASAGGADPVSSGASVSPDHLIT